MKTHVRHEICRFLISGCFHAASFSENFQLTVSHNLANAGIKVGGASLCLSIPSNTNTKCFKPSFIRGWSNIELSEAASWANVSHRCDEFSPSSVLSHALSALVTATMILSKK